MSAPRMRRNDPTRRGDADPVLPCGREAGAWTARGLFLEQAEGRGFELGVHPLITPPPMVLTVITSCPFFPDDYLRDSDLMATFLRVSDLSL